MKLAGKVALITGAGSGIGRATAILFAQEGAKVALVGRTATKLEETARMIGTDGWFIIPADLSRREEVRRAVDTCAEHFGGLDIVINSAGILRLGKVVEVDEPLLDDLVANNVKNPLWVAQSAIPWFRRRGGGAIINISSNVSTRPNLALGPYAMTKAMVDLLTLALSLEHARESIRANTICPGLVDTPIHETYMSPEEAAQRLEEGKRVYPLGRIGTPEDIARAALYLASDDASWISGITLLVDGGRWLSK